MLIGQFTPKTGLDLKLKTDIVLVMGLSQLDGYKEAGEAKCEQLGLDPAVYAPVIVVLETYWKRKIPDNGERYLNYSLLNSSCPLKSLLATPAEWEEVGKFLADATEATYHNGSYDFIVTLVPQLVRHVARTLDDLKQYVGVILENVNAYYDGAHEFQRLAERIKSGELRSLEDIRMAYPKKGEAKTYGVSSSR